LGFFDEQKLFSKQIKFVSSKFCFIGSITCIYSLDSLADFGFFLLLQVAWQPWTQNITWRRLDPRRVKVIDYLWEIKAAQLEAVFSLEGQIIK